MPRKTAPASKSPKSSGPSGQKKVGTRLPKSPPLQFITEKSFSTLIEKLDHAVFTLDTQGRVTYISPLIEKVSSYRVKEVIGKKFTEFIQPEYLPNLEEEFANAIHGNLGRIPEFRIHDRNGRVHHLQASAQPLIVDEKFVGLMGILIDVSSQKDAESEVRQAQDMYQNLVERIPAVVYTDAPDENWSTLFISPQLEDLTGYTPQEWMSDNTLWMRLVHPEDHDRVEEASRQADRSGEQFNIEYRMVRRDGEIIWVHDEANLLLDADDQPLCWQGILFDITDRKLAEQARQDVEQDLRAREEQYRQMVELSPEAIAIHCEGKVVFANPSAVKLLGGSRYEDIVGEPIEKFFYTEDWEETNKRVRKALESHQPIPVAEQRLIKIDGSFITVEMSSMPFSYLGNPSLQVMIRDITDRKLAEQVRKEAEQDLRAREQQYRQMVELSPEAIAIHSEGKVLYANPGALKLIGARSLEDVVGKSITDFFLPEDHRTVLRSTRQAIQQQKVIPLSEERLVRLDGTVIDVEMSTLPFPSQGKSALQVLMRDITERKQAQALQQAVYKIALATESTHSLNDLFPRIHEIIASVMPAENFYITLFDEQENLLHFPYFKDIQDEPFLSEIQPGKGLTAYVLRTGKSLLCTQAVHDELERQGAVILLGVPSAIWLGVPLITEGKTVGAMVVQHYTDPEAYSEREQHMLEFVSSQVAIAITRKQAEEALTTSETSYRGLFNSVQEAIYIQDRDGTFLDVNEGASRMYGYTRDELVGKSPLSISAPGRNDLESIKNMIDRAFQDDPQEFEFWGIRKNGEIFPKNVRLTKGVYFGQKVVIAVAEDITERKNSEDALQRQLKELTILQSVSIVSTEAVIIDDLLERVTGIIVKTFSLDSFGILLYDRHKKVLATHSSYYGKKIPRAPETISLDEGITGKVASTGLSCRLGDVSTDQRYIAVTPGMKSEVCVPIKAGNDLLGVINAESRHPDYFTASDELLFMSIASSLATTIQKLSLFQSEYKRRQEAENLRQAVAVISSSLSLNKVLETILDSINKVVSYDSASVILYRPDGDYLQIVAGRGLPKESELIGKCFRPTAIWKKMVETRKAVIVTDAQVDSRFEKWTEVEYIRGWMTVPLIIRDRVIGYITIDSRQTDTYTEENAVLAQNFAYTATIAVENARLYESERHRRNEAEILRQAAAAVSASLDLHQVLDTILGTLKQVVSYNSASIMLVDGKRLHLAAVMGLKDPESLLDLTFPANDRLLSRVRRSKKPLILPDASVEPLFHGWAGTDQVRGWMAAPLIVRNNVIGYITINSDQPSVYNEDSAAVVLSFAYQAATAIENARLYESEQRRRKEEETLRQAVSIVASTLEVDQSIKLILDQLERVVPCDSASVLILRPDSLEIVGGKGWKNPQDVLGLRFPYPGENPNTLVVRERRSLILDTTDGKYADFSKDLHRHIKSWLGVPLIAKNEVIGMLSLDSRREKNFYEESARLATLFASQVALALENSRLYQDAVKAAERRAILHRASQEISRAAMRPEEIYQAVHHAAERLITVDAFVISLLDEVNKEILAVYLFDHGTLWPPVRTRLEEGMSGKVILSGEPVMIQNLTDQPLKDAVHYGSEEIEVQSVLAVPMRHGDRVIGMISAQSYQPHMYSEEDQALLEMLAAHAAVAIENARLYRETRQRLSDLEVVNRISIILRQAHTKADMLPRLLEEVLGILQTDAGTIWLYDSSTQLLKPATAIGWFNELNEYPIPPGEGITGTVFQSGQTHITSDFASDPLTRESSRKVIPVGWGGACLPIRTVQESIGVILISVRLPRQLQAEEISLLTTICEIAGNAIRRADLYDQTQRQVQRLASLRAIDMAINTILDLRVTLGILIDHIHTQLQVDAVDVLLLNPSTQVLYHGASSGFHSVAANTWQVHISEDIAGRSVRTRSTTYIQRISEDTLSKRLLNLSSEQFVSYYCVPLVAKGQVKGVLEIFHRALLEPDVEWKNFLETLAGQAALAIDNSVLFEDLQRSNVDLALAYDATIEGWSKALDLRDRETEGHTQRVTDVTIELAQLMGVNGSDQIHIRRGALLHDIGKMGVPDIILNKPAALDDDEWAIMHRHPVFAYEMLYPIAYLRPAVDIPYCHHERWNGEGYPRGLRGEEIPLAARLFAVVDVWDALISDRPYRQAWANASAIEYIQENSGILFDPAIVTNFLSLMRARGNM